MGRNYLSLAIELRYSAGWLIKTKLKNDSLSYLYSMGKQKHSFYSCTRPGEYVAFINFSVPTMEGPGYVFLGCDAFSEFAFSISVEPDNTPETVLKCIRLLLKDKDFSRHKRKGFTLVFDRFEELSDEIESILNPEKGKAIFNKNFHDRIAEPVMGGLSDFIREKR